MDSAFAWLGYIMEWLGRFIPRVVIVRATHGGIKFIYGHKIKQLRNFDIYWPLTTDIEIIPIARQTTNLNPQRIITVDEVVVGAGGIVIYEITDIVKALSENYDVEATINDIAQAAIVQVVSSNTYKHLICEIANKVETELTKVTRQKLQTYGVRVIRCALTDFAPCRVISLLGERL